MLKASKDKSANVAIEMNSIAVESRNEERGECWKYNISSQFPIISTNTENGEVVLDVDSPHKGYSIRTVMENGKMSGESRILNERNIKVASLVFVDGIANGPCTLYDSIGKVFFEGFFANGYREGKGKEYDENGNMIYEGFFDKGKRMNIVIVKEMKGYWKEMNDKNEVISICRIDDECRNDGICYFYSNGEIDRISEWKNGEEISDSGYCRIYDEPHQVFFEGHFENGKREGKGKEFDLNGKVVFNGFYSDGRRMSIVPMKEMKGYWKEMNEKNEVISVCKKDDECRNDGICYFYSNGNIDRISEWKNGEELNIVKRFEGKKMIEFVNGVKRYEGEYRDSIKHNYPREGEGEEYDTDGKSVIYHGHYWNGRKQGKGMGYRNGDTIYDGIWIKGYQLNNIVWISIIIMILSIIISFVCLWWWLGIILLGIDLVFCIVLGICYCCSFGRKKQKKNNKSNTLPIKDENKYYKKLTCFVVLIFVVIVFNIIYAITIFITRQILVTQCLGSIFQSSLYVRYDSCDYAFITSFKPKSKVELIDIRDYCFENVDTFKIDGLNELKSLKIGYNSFTKNRYGDNYSRSFHILNCIELKSIEIGSYSFSDYGGGFELKNLPKLSTLKIGEIGRDSYNFRYSSFVIKGIIDIVIDNE